MTKIDRAAVRVAIAEVRAQQDHTERRSLEHEELGRRMTILCCIQAHSRGRLHMTKLTKAFWKYTNAPIEQVTLADQAEIIGEAFDEFALT